MTRTITYMIETSMGGVIELGYSADQEEFEDADAAFDRFMEEAKRVFRELPELPAVTESK